MSSKKTHCFAADPFSCPSKIALSLKTYDKSYSRHVGGEIQNTITLGTSAMKIILALQKCSQSLGREEKACVSLGTSDGLRSTGLRSKGHIWRAKIHLLRVPPEMIPFF